ncbi:organic hydroperoxide reductase OsmC/OhrA [Murinocardiopsis flavida]|uniref:Organic hydroperoxide reductase OsmC/OhrA n=1 Tax=Murinocardiopsis flavida TaxID=645275 RepID=A0A2P8DJK9_9ACTN|nr:OsmC family protein [Murinocardiopsis flavida]PSK97413.1 organic hydroperoxide reductase OsmC/OhrA [Murinocardiopsis flavida]
MAAEGMRTRGKEYRYEVRVTWTGNNGNGTATFRGFERSVDIEADGRPVLPASADSAFRGDAARWNPEDLLTAALSECHLLSYLGIAAANGVSVVAYRDTATAVLATNPDGSGQFTEVILHPEVVVAEPAMLAAAEAMHAKAAELCFIARSVNFPVRHRPRVTAAEPSA